MSESILKSRLSKFYHNSHKVARDGQYREKIKEAESQLEAGHKHRLNYSSALNAKIPTASLRQISQHAKIFRGWGEILLSQVITN